MAIKKQKHAHWLLLCNKETGKVSKKRKQAQQMGKYTKVGRSRKTSNGW